MFTGLVEEKGIVESISTQGSSADLEVRGSLVSVGVALGDSIAINGCCLTVVAIDESCLTFQAGEETLKRTNLGDLVTGSDVNLERSLQVGQRMGGHYVSGHVDGLAEIIEITDEGDSTRVTLRAPHALAGFIASKGSVALNGASLTVNDVQGTDFGINFIPHTKSVTTWGRIAVGDLVNLEIDTLARYVARLQDWGQYNS